MPTELPACLQDFLKHRQNHISKTTPADAKKKGLMPATKNNDLDASVGSIIDKKPGRKLVDEFFQKRADELSKSKMK